VTGNAFWEVLRDGRGEIVRLVYVPSYSVRLLPLDREPVEIEDRIRVSPVSFEMVSARRRARRYVQVQGTERIYFKSFRDPRVVSRRTGQAFTDVETLLKADPSDGPATEIIHFAIHSPRSPYGVPRWVGTLLSVLGSRQMEEVRLVHPWRHFVPRPWNIQWPRNEPAEPRSCATISSVSSSSTCRRPGCCTRATRAATWRSG